MPEWIIPCNLKQYNIHDAFKKLHKLDWKQSTNAQKGDIVYIYIGAPESSIRYKTIVNKADKPKCTIDDSEFVLDGTNFISYGRYMELELLEEYNSTELHRINLQDNGLKSIQGPSRASEKLSLYLSVITRNKTLSHNNDIPKKKNCEKNLDDIYINELNSISKDELPTFETYIPLPMKKTTPIINGEYYTYPRNKITAIKALNRAKYLCEFEEKHSSFIRKSNGTPYTEPHHLIPMSEQKHYTNSLDVQANIVSLCSNCHNELHYGQNPYPLLKKLYELRKYELKAAGIEIKYENLKKYYL